VERAGFEIRDVEGLRPHYALTLRHWVQRLEDNCEAALREADEPHGLRVLMRLQSTSVVLRKINALEEVDRHIAVLQQILKRALEIPAIFAMNDMDNKRPAAHKPMKEAFKQWPLMTFYDRFELVVAVVLSLIVTLIISLALLQLIVRVVPLLVTGSLNPLDHSVFQSLFGMIMTVLIAMEFKHSIIRVAQRKDSIVQVKTVVLISLIALARKFVILDTTATPAMTIAALAAATLVLGVVYWLLRERDDRLVHRPAAMGDE